MQVSHKTPYQFRRAELMRNRDWITWYIAWFLLAMSFLGSFAAGNGGMANVVSGKLSYSGTVVALIVQLFLTWIQWSWADFPGLVILSRIVGTVLTTYGYSGLFIVPLVSSLVDMGIPTTNNIAHALAYSIMGVIFFVPEWYPEIRLVKGKGASDE